LHQALLTGMLSVQAVPPRIRPSQEWAQLLSQALIDGAIVSSWCHPRVLAGERLPSWSGLITVPLGTLPMQLVCHPPATASDSAPRKVLLPRRNVTPLLHEALAWYGFQVEQQPISCQDVPSWLKRMHDRQLAMPLCPGLVDQGWIQAQSLVPHLEQPHLVKQLWLLLPQGLVGSSREARLLIRTLRQRVEKAGEASQAGPAEDSSETYATSA
jgi:DNA-binding transcriptional LysR family regulator